MEAPGDGLLIINKTPPAWQSNKDEIYEANEKTICATQA